MIKLLRIVPELTEAEDIAFDVVADTLHLVELCVELLEVHFLALARDQIAKVLDLKVYFS